MKTDRFYSFNSGVFLTWLLSYLSILLIPIVISIIVYTESGKVVENEINRANGALLKQVQRELDTLMKDIEQLSLQIAWNQKVQKFMYARSPLRNSDYYAITQILQDFKVYKASNGHVDDFFVFFNNIDSVLMPDGYFRADVLYRIKFQNEELSYSAWHDILERQHLRTFFPLARERADGKSSRTIAYARSLPIEDPYQSTGKLIILLDEKHLQEVIKNIKWVDCGNIFIIDGYNNIIASTEQMSQFGAFTYTGLKGSSGLLYDRINGEEAAVSYIKSQHLDWKYVSVIPVKVFMEKAQYIRKLTFVCLFLCIALGGIVAFIFSKFQYNPIYRLVQVLQKRVDFSPAPPHNEYHFLHEAISSTLDERDEISRKLKQQNAVLRANFLRKLLKGKLENAYPVEDALSTYELQFTSGNFAVALVYLENYGIFHDRRTSEDGSTLAQFATGNVLEELFRQDHRVYMAYMVDVDEMPACLINFTTPSPNHEDLMCTLKKAQQFMQEKFSITFTVSISRIHSTLSGISVAYREAVEAMEYKIVAESGSILLFDHIRKVHNHYSYSLDMEQHLINYIKAGEFDNANELLSRIFEQNLLHESPSVQLTRCLMADLACTMIKALEEIHSTLNHTFLETLRPMEQLLACETVLEMKGRMTGILKEVCRHIERNKKSHNSRLKERIITLVEEKYQDLNLNVASLARMLQMNSSYLSKFFKEQTGESLADYIHKVRVEKAKQMLKNENFSISRVAGMVGYCDSNTLIRVFKKFEGITPGQYKESFL